MKTLLHLSALILALSAQPTISIAQNVNVQTEVVDRLHLMTDRINYQPGERIWFSVFLFDANSRKIDTPTEYVHIELMNKDLSVTSRVLVNKQDDSFTGYIDIPKDMQQGACILRAYSQTTAGIQEFEAISRLSVGTDYRSTEILSNLVDYQPDIMLRSRGDSVMVSLVLPDEVLGQDATLAISITKDSVDVHNSIVNSVNRALPAEPVKLSLPEESQSIRGYVTDLLGDRVENKVVLSLMAPLEGFTAVAVSDTLGRFSFDNLEFADGVTIFIQASDHQGEGNYRINLRDNVNVPCTYLTGQSYIPELEDEWLDDFDGKRLDEVIVKSKKRVEKMMVRGHYSDAADQIFTNKYIRERGYTDIYNIFQSIAGCRVDASHRVYLRATGINGAVPALIIVDGVTIDYDVDNYLQTILVEDIVQIDVFKTIGSGALWGARDRGAISITTGLGMIRNTGIRSPNILKQTIKGHQTHAEFKPSDGESTIYWNPYINTRGVNRLSFLVPKTSHAYVHVEGLTSGGKTIFLNKKAY